jgi:hypothetical protein
MQAFQRQTVAFDWRPRTQFGADASMNIPNSGDIVNRVLLRLMWPNTSNVNLSVGTAMINMVELLYGDIVLERVYGENMYMMSDLMVSQGKRAALTNLTGMDLTTPLTEYHIELPFTMKFPLFLLDKNPTVRVIFNQPNTFMSVPYLGRLDLKLVVEYAFLSQAEKFNMQNTKLVYTTQFYQLLQFTARPTETVFNVVTSFIGNVKELFWIIQDPTTSQYNYRLDLVSLGLSFNGIEFLSPYIGTPIYLNKIQPLEHHTKNPTSNIYVYSFAINPESEIPSGEVNLTNIMNQMHSFVIKPYANTRNIRIYASTYNLVTISNGELSVKYTLGESGFKN